MKIAILLLAALATGCDGDLPQPWELDHDRIVAVRATPPAILPGERSEIDALISLEGGLTAEQAPEIAAVISPMVLSGALANDGGRWVVTYPPEAMLDAARKELDLPPGAAVPLTIGVLYGGGSLAGTKSVVLGATRANPTLADMTIDGVPLDSLVEVVVTRDLDIRFAVPAEIDDDVNWLTYVGEMHDFDLPESYLRVEPDYDERLDGELALVKRDQVGGVVWRVWPIRVE